MATVYLIPSLLHEEGMEALPAYILPAVRECQVFFVENERTSRRFLKLLSKEIVIDDYEWYNVADASAAATFKQKIKENKVIGLLSEAGCPGVADPGQAFVAIAQDMNADVKPLVGPNSILLALMASGMNGQQFLFAGYLPIDNVQRAKAIRELEANSSKNNCTQIFIETPYRNNQMIEAVLKNCKPATRFCIAADLTSKKEWVKTKTVAQWQQQKPDMHKRPVIFLLLAE